MLARMWLNALSDGSAMNAQARSIYVRALTKPSIARSMITTPCGCLSSVLNFKKFKANTHGYCKLYQTVPRTAGVSPIIRQNRVQGNTITGTVSFRGALFKPILGVIKWYAIGCLPFTTSRSVGNEVKNSGRKKLNSMNKKHSGMNTSKKCQTEQRQIQESSKTMRASSKHSRANGHMDVAETSKPMKTQSRSKSTIAKGNPSSPNNNKRPSSTLLKREIIVQEPISGSKEPFTTSGSAGIDVKKSGTMKLNSSKKKLSVVNTSKKCQTEQRRIQESSKTTKASLKHSPAIDQVDVAKTGKLVKTMSSSKSQIEEGKTSLAKNNEEFKHLKWAKDTLLERETNFQDSLHSLTELTTASHKPQAKKLDRSKVIKSESTNKNSIKIEKIDKKASSKDADHKPQVAVIGAKTRSLPKVINDEQATKTNVKANRTAKTHSTNIVQKLQAAAGERSKSGNTKATTDKKHSTNVVQKLQATAGERSKSGNRGACLQESRMISLTKAKKMELPDNVKLVSGKLSEKKKANTSVHAEGKVLVVVESATKAKTIQKYLGDRFVVLASYGHVRDLAGRAGSVRPLKGFDMVWEVPSAAWQHIRAIEAASTRASSVVLASDPDREGEAIAWHVTEMLKMQASWNKNMLVKRVVFHEITESAIRNAMETPRDISMDLVNAYLARRALDYLIGFNISPILWRKLPGCQSAGRVQSAALCLICDREKEIENFVPQEYWTIEAEACTSEQPVPGRNYTVPVKVTHVDGEKLEKFTIKSEAEAVKVAEKVSSSKFKVLNLETSIRKKNAPLPYITSTLQRDASNKLNFRTSHTMKVAQKLYEGVKISDNEVVGLITYMRTDGLRISEDALKSIHLQVIECYGQDFVVEGVRKFVNKVKNAQEAHEAVRPTDIRRTPWTLANVLEKDALKLYTLIWCRTMACQMRGAKINQISVTFGNEDESLLLRSSGSAISFPGYLAVFKAASILDTKLYLEGFYVEILPSTACWFNAKFKDRHFPIQNHFHSKSFPVSGSWFSGEVNGVLRCPQPLNPCCSLPHLHAMSFKEMRSGGSFRQFWHNLYSSDLSPKSKNVCFLWWNHLGHISQSTSKNVMFCRRYYTQDDNKIQFVEGEDEGEDEAEKMEDGKFSFLSQLKAGEPIDLIKAEELKHLTEPLPRYSEGTLVKMLEELGIGRPSTYAPILKTLEAREYVTVRSRRIYPEFRGRMLSSFLAHYFPEYINYVFTAKMESQLDDISAGRTEWKNLLNEFWERFNLVCGRVKEIDIYEVEKMLEETFDNLLFPGLPVESRVCPACHDGNLKFKVTRHGAGYFIGCDKYPKCSHITRTMFTQEDNEEQSNMIDTRTFPTPKPLGNDPSSNQQVFLKQGPYGSYLQLGDNTKGFTPKRANVSQIKDIDAITLEDALDILRYPIILGKHPSDKEPVELRRTKTGFSIRYRHFISAVPKNVDHQTITLDMALHFLESEGTKRTGRPSFGKSKPRAIKPKKSKSAL